jgi:hypothetical protein
MERSVLDELPLRGRGLGFVGFDPRQNLFLRDLCGRFDAAGNRANHVGNPIAPGGHSRQHLLGRHTAILGETIVAVDGHANDELGVFRIPEVHPSQHILVGQVHVDIRVQRSLGSTSQFIFRAVAPRAVSAQEGIKSIFESRQGPCFVETIRNDKCFYVGSAASVGKL